MTDQHSHDHHHERHGAKQPERFDPARAGRLDDPQRLTYLPPDEIFGLLDAPEGSLVIDFGAGTGVFTIELGRRRPDLRIVAIDEQPQMLELLRAKPAAAELSNIELTLVSDQAMTALRNRADRLMVINVLHELGDDALRSMLELLHPQGVALIVDWAGEVERPIGPPAGHVYATAEAQRKLETFGMRVEQERMLPYHFVLRARRN